MPEKNTSYRGVVRFVCTDHSQYGCQPIILQYEFPNLEGPYIHDHLFDEVCNWSDQLQMGIIYERYLTFRNYRWYLSKITQVLKPLTLNYGTDN